MQDKEIYEKLVATFHSVFDDGTINIRPETSAAEIEAWDSFNHVNLLLAIESSFHIKFSTQDMESMQNVGDIADIIRKKLS